MDEPEPVEVVVRESTVPTVAVRVQRPMAELDMGALFEEHLPRVAHEALRPERGAIGPPYARWFVFGPDHVDVEIGIPLRSDADDLPVADEGSGAEIGRSELPAGRWAVTHHHGAYQDLAGAYRRLESWIADQGYAGGGAPWETYLVMPEGAGGDPASLVTEVAWPLA